MKISLSNLNKNTNKLWFYISKSLLTCKPRHIANLQFDKLTKQYETFDTSLQIAIMQRVNYYNRVSQPFKKNENFTKIKNFKLKGNPSISYLDLASLLPYFDKDKSFAYNFLDKTSYFSSPTFVKNRPLGEGYQNSILLKLNSARNFYLPKDTIAYEQKIPKIIWRGAARQPHRLKLMELYGIKNNLLDIGCTTKHSIGKPYHANHMSIDEQRRYKFLLSIEGNDIASNLKWAMASNSLVFMTKPTYESWFMEGTLKPNFHYVLLKDNYEDLEEKIDYYKNNSNKAQEIIENAHRYIEPFLNSNQEKLIQLLVIKKYFDNLIH